MGLLKLLAKKNYQKRDIIMIGDDNADLELADVVTTFYAVGNCTKELRKVSEYVSPFNYTEGVEDILVNQILNKYEE